MLKPWMRTGLMETLGTFALVFIASAVVCVNVMTTPAGQVVEHSPQTAHQPGLIGIALAQGLMLALMLELMATSAGGFFNPAITIALWVFNRLATRPMLGLIVCQMVGAVLAGGVVLLLFRGDVAQSARLGTPHLNALAYDRIADRSVSDRGAQVTGAGIELILTFFLVLAIFGAGRERRPGRYMGFWAGAALTAGVLVGYPLTGAATNPARFLGPALWETTLTRPLETPGPMADVFVYVAGPILGALAAALVAFKVLDDKGDDGGAAGAPAVSVPPGRPHHEKVQVKDKR